MSSAKEVLDMAVDSGQDLSDIKQLSDGSSVSTSKGSGTDPQWLWCVCGHLDSSHIDWGICRKCKVGECLEFYPSQLMDESPAAGGKVTDWKNEHTSQYFGHHGGSGVSYSTPKCRHAATAAFEWDGVTYYGGSQSQVEYQSFDEEWMIISCLGPWSPKTTKKNIITSKLTDLAKKLNKWVIDDKQTNEPTVCIDWNDYGAPKLYYGFWSQIHQIAKDKGYKHVLFYCFGGHGRTGTALASMLIEICGFDAKSAADWIHKEYCKEAIESSSQKDYLNALYKVAAKVAEEKK